MAACSDYLKRVYVRSWNGSPAMRAYIASEFGARREAWFLGQATRTSARGNRRQGTWGRLAAYLGRATSRTARSTGERLSFQAEARRW